MSRCSSGWFSSRRTGSGRRRHAHGQISRWAKIASPVTIAPTRGNPLSSVSAAVIAFASSGTTRSDHRPELGRKGREHVQRRGVEPAAAAQRLAVKRDVPARRLAAEVQEVTARCLPARSSSTPIASWSMGPLSARQAAEKMFAGQLRWVEALLTLRNIIGTYQKRNARAWTSAIGRSGRASGTSLPSAREGLDRHPLAGLQQRLEIAEDPRPAAAAFGRIATARHHAGDHRGARDIMRDGDRTHALPFYDFVCEA